MDKTDRIKQNLRYFKSDEMGIDIKLAQLQKELWEMSDYADKLAKGLPCLPKDVENLKQSNLDLATENGKLRKIIGKFRCPNDNKVFALYVSFCEDPWELLGLYWKEKDAAEIMEKYQRVNLVSKYMIEEVEII